jgi:small subunit ribosomal protein S8
MPVTDSIADYLTRVRNAQSKNKTWVDCPASNLKKKLSLILKHEGYIKDFIIVKDGIQDFLRIYLKYDHEGNPTIEGLKRASKPSKRYYVKRDEIPRTLNGLGITILTTSKGIVTDKIAKANNVGGEVLCYIW